MWGLHIVYLPTVAARCINCKAKRRKCDEAKPACGRCSSRSEKCEWASRLTFRAENALGVEPSSLHRPPGRPPARFRIKDVTAEVIRDYQHYDPGDDLDVSDQSDGQQATAPNDVSPSTVHDQGTPYQEHFNWQHNPTFPAAEPNLTSLRSTDYVPLPTPGDLESIWHSPVATTYLDDSVFLPGSAYLDAHSTFRSHLIQEVRSNVPTRQATPDPTRIEHVWGVDADYNPDTESHITEIATTRINAVEEEQTPANPSSAPQLSPEEEFALWKNWFDEVAPWIDKFDPERHFRHTLPVIARSHDHLRYSILALSARQMERKNNSKHTERSLSLYQTAIQLVLPQLHTRSTPVIASCVVLCVLEMLSSSAKAWHQHLDGCAHLLEAVGINGFSGGVNQALFWCFARMDVCGGLIASSKTLIPVEHWADGMDLDGDVERFRADGGYNVHACEAVYLVAQILDLLSFHSNLAGRVGATPPTCADADEAYTARWTRLWSHVSAWYAARPAEMLPISCFSTSPSSFPKILYSNPAAMSGNQLHHTACILLLRHKPSGVTVTPKPNSIFWHARQICGISISNDDHAAWTNAIQPLWIAGQWMSHESEQKAILQLLEKIEKQSGWSTKWRAEDLKEFWG
ncbi:hypothetical protein AA0111_g10044 [Alternaria arborescens]|uniref:hypothetical protein n=1 Tax=Alternaria arborescens TaxID=156630 RepID=UPI001074B8CD|nr:hypothetical protein AA0111_g10044 [Alternaria arborescens]RYO20503.1 hypothetical protein AA0111_g10044 [Alternaria arborescens]